MKLEAEKQVTQEKLKLAQLRGVRRHRREHSDDYYRDATRKRASAVKVSDMQHLINYNSVIIFIRDCEN